MRRWHACRRSSRVGDSGSSCIRVATRRLGLNRIEGLSAQLVTGREDVFYRWEFDAAAEQLPDDLINRYVRRVSNPDSLRGSFGGYRALDTIIPALATWSPRRPPTRCSRR